MVARAIKYTIAARAMQRDLDLGIAPTRPTTVHTDVEAVLQGRGGERMTKSARWLGPDIPWCGGWSTAVLSVGDR